MTNPATFAALGPRGLLLGRGAFPSDLRAELEAEGPLFLEEGLYGTLTLRHHRAPRERASVRKQAFSAAIAVTRRRLVVWSGTRFAARAGCRSTSLATTRATGGSRSSSRRRAAC